MLSWDNSTTRGYPGCKPNYVFAWTDTMKNEIIKLSDIDEDKISVTVAVLNLIIIFQMWKSQEMNLIINSG